MSGDVTILSGDLVGSTDLDGPALERAFDGLARAAGDIAGWRGAPVRFTRNRGDGWQICLDPPGPGLREALVMRAGLRRLGRDLETRIAIASGPADLPGSGDLNAASGPAFTASGRLLERLEGPLMGHAAGGALAAATVLADEISAGWTEAQARAVLPMLAPDPPTQAEAAETLGITRQAVRQALVAAGHPALSRALAALEEAP